MNQRFVHHRPTNLQKRQKLDRRVGARRDPVRRAEEGQRPEGTRESDGHAASDRISLRGQRAGIEDNLAGTHVIIEIFLVESYAVQKVL